MCVYTNQTGVRSLIYWMVRKNELKEGRITHKKPKLFAQ